MKAIVASVALIIGVVACGGSASATPPLNQYTVAAAYKGLYAAAAFIDVTGSRFAFVAGCVANPNVNVFACKEVQ